MHRPREDGQSGGSDRQRLQRSRTGCPQCRRRKIKCDEQRPECGQCSRSGRACELVDGAFKHHVFSVDSAPWRFQRTSTVSSPSPILIHRPPLRNDSNGMSPSTGYDDPAAVTEPLAAPPCEPSPMLMQPDDKTRTPAAPGLWSSGSHTGPLRDADLETLHPASVTAATRIGTHTVPSGIPVTSEETFFLRIFCEGPGRWMDVTDSTHFFERRVPILARNNDLIRYAACAVGAKHLGQMEQPMSGVGSSRGQIDLAKRLTSTSLDFLWYGAKYYEKCIRLLTEQISPSALTPGFYPSPNEIYRTSAVDSDSSPASEERTAVLRLVGVMLLCQYEHLNCMVRAWSGHLNGVEKFLTLFDDGALYVPRPGYKPPTCPEVRAVFWQFVVQDLEESFISHHRTRVDPENWQLWRNMGLTLDDQGQAVPTVPLHDYLPVDMLAFEETAFHFLLRSMCQLKNSEHNENITRLEHQALLSRIDMDLQVWQQAFACLMLPDGTSATVRDAAVPATNRAPAQESWYSSQPCAVITAYYHMARILLTIRRPLDAFRNDLRSTSPGLTQSASFDLLRTMNKLQQTLAGHAEEVISIAMAVPQGATRVSLIQPLYVVGRCLPHTEAQETLIRLLADIESDLGVFTSYRIEGLVREWQLA